MIYGYNMLLHKWKFFLSGFRKKYFDKLLVFFKIIIECTRANQFFKKPEIFFCEFLFYQERRRRKMIQMCGICSNVTLYFYGHAPMLIIPGHYNFSFSPHPSHNELKRGLLYSKKFQNH